MAALRSVERLMRLIETLAATPAPLPLARLSEGTGLDKATARRFALALRELGYAERDAAGRYRLTAKLGDLIEEARRPQRLLASARDALRVLAAETGMAVSISRLRGRDVEYVLREPRGRVRGVSLEEGARLPAHATAIGKVLLAELPPAQVRRLYPRERLPAMTPRTIATRTLLEGALQEIRRQGWALSDGELEDGLRAAAVPVRSADGAAICALNASSEGGAAHPGSFALEVVPKLLRATPQIAGILEDIFAVVDQTSSR